MSVPRLRFPGFGGEWGHLKLGELGPVSMCKRIMKEETNTIGDVPFYKIGTFGKEPDAFISTELYAKFKKKYPYPKVGDILISAAGTIGRLVIFDGSPAYFQDSNIVWVANGEEKVSNAFLFRCYENTRWTTENTTIARLYNDNLRSLKLVAPTLPEQKKIAAFLGAVDAKIAALRARVLGLQTYKRGLMQALFSQTLRFTKPDGLAFPDWEEKRLGEIGEVFGGLSGKSAEDFGDGMPFITYKQVFDSAEILLVRCELVRVGKKEKQNRVLVGDVLFTTSSETPAEVGFASVLLEDAGELYLNSFCFGFRAKNSGQIMPRFSMYLFRAQGYRKAVFPLAQGSTRYNLSKAEFLKIKILLPHPDEQAKIAEALSAMDAKIAAAQLQVDRMQDFKKGLLQQMFV